MKTNSEIQAEAQHLTVLGRHYFSEQRQVAVSNVVAMPRALVTLPAPHNRRHIEAALEGGELVFRLMERESDHSGLGDNVPFTVMSSHSAADALRAGYELGEEERLAAELERFAERSEDYAEPADAETVATVERVLETHSLSPAERMRTRTEVVAFLEGRLEPSALIARAIERQEQRDDCREALIERNEFKLTVGQP